MHPGMTTSALRRITDAPTRSVRARCSPMFKCTRVEAAMTKGVISCEPDTALAEVASIMSERRVHAVYVFDEEAADVWGLVSDLDLVAAARGDLDHVTARDASVTPLVVIETHDSLDRAAQLLAENDVSHLTVIDPRTRRPVGVLSTLDLAHVIADQPGARSKMTSTLNCS
jgi:CBS domain-containing protein